MEQLIVLGKITATSNKQGNFKSENPRKTLYISLDDDNTKKAVDFGLTEYESEDGESFFMIKASEKITCYNRDGEVIKTVSGTIDEGSPNFQSDGLVGIAIIKGESKGNHFFRVFSILGDVTEIERENPFKDFIDLDF